MKPLHVIALYKFKENYLIDAIEILKVLVINTRKEQGCIQYDLVEDNEQKGDFFLVEQWETELAHNQHLGQDTLLEFRQSAAPMLENSTLIYKGFRVF